MERRFDHMDRRVINRCYPPARELHRQNRFTVYKKADKIKLELLKTVQMLSKNLDKEGLTQFSFQVIFVAL